MKRERTNLDTDRAGFFAGRPADLIRAVALRVAFATAIFGLTASAIAGENPELHSGKPGFSPATRLRQWFQTGQASWYGLKFQGRKTATGETFDMNALTCAHRSLPLGTWLRVTNLRNRKSVLVRVNDRGPMVDNRIVDLSYAAARAVGIGGISRVKLEKVSANDPEIARAAVARVLMAQVSPFSFPRLIPAH